MADPVYNVLFLGAANSTRSILAESILRKNGAGRFNAFSAAGVPEGQVNPCALRVLTNFGYPTAGLRSKSWDEFTGAAAPVMDFVFTLCDSAAAQTCPIWPGNPITAHWGIEDPAAAQGTELVKYMIFVSALQRLRTRIGVFLSLPRTTIDSMAMAARAHQAR